MMKTLIPTMFYIFEILWAYVIQNCIKICPVIYNLIIVALLIIFLNVSLTKILGMEGTAILGMEGTACSKYFVIFKVKYLHPDFAPHQNLPICKLNSYLQ